MADGNFTTTSVGKVWTLRISVPNATSISVLFDNFNIIPTAELYIFNDSRNILDSCIKKEHFVTEMIGIPPMSGNSVILYLVEKGNFRYFQSSISIKNLELGYLPIQDVGVESLNLASGKVTASTACDPSIQCNPDKLKYARSVGRIVVAGRAGTGTMVNNEENNGKPYFLTAFHIVDLNSNGLLDQFELEALATARFQFRFWRQSCNGSNVSYGVQFSGATLQAWSHATDMLLLEILNPPGIGDKVNLAGWNRSSSAPNGYSPFVLHHPQGHDMRITGVSSVSSWLWNSNYWTAHYYSGTVDKGSSGSGLFNANGQVIGQLRSGWSSCDFTDFGDRYGKFDKSWSSGLQNVLSPIQNLTAVGLLNLAELEIDGPDIIACTTATTYSTYNLHGVTYEWSVSAGLQIISGQGTNQVTISGLPGGQYGSSILSLKLTSSKGIDRDLEVSKNIKIFTGGSGSITGTYNSSNSDKEPLVVTPPKVLDFPGNFSCIAVLTNMDIPQGSTVSWSGTADPGVTWNQVDDKNVFISFSAVNQIADLNVTVLNSCGSSSSRYRFRCTTTSSCGIQPMIGNGFVLNRLKLSPNPSIEKVELSIDNKGSYVERSIKTVRIYNKMGTLISVINPVSNTHKVTIDVSSFTPDTYFIEIFDGLKWEREKLLKY